MSAKEKKIKLRLLILLVVMFFSNIMCFHYKVNCLKFNTAYRYGTMSLSTSETDILLLFIFILIVCSLIEFHLISELLLSKKMKIIVNITAVFILLASLCYVYTFIYTCDLQEIGLEQECYVFIYKNYDLINLVFDINKIALVVTFLLNSFLIFNKLELKEKEDKKFRIFDLKNLKYVLLVFMIFACYSTYNVNKSANTVIDFADYREKYEFYTKEYKEGNQKYWIYMHTEELDFNNCENKIESKLFTTKEDYIPLILEQQTDALDSSFRNYLDWYYNAKRGGYDFKEDDEENLRSVQVVNGKLGFLNKGDTMTFKYKDTHGLGKEYGITFKNNTFTVKAGEGYD